MSDRVTIRWTWSCPPWVASWTDRHGRQRGVARWTRWAAYDRAFWLREAYINKLFDVARRDLRDGNRESANEIIDWIRMVNRDNAEIWVTTENVNHAKETG